MDCRDKIADDIDKIASTLVSGADDIGIIAVMDTRLRYIAARVRALPRNNPRDCSATWLSGPPNASC